MNGPEPHEAVIGRRGRWRWDRPASEPFGPRAHPERCTDEWEKEGLEAIGSLAGAVNSESAYRVAVLRRLSLLGVVMGVVALQVGLLLGGGFLFLRWLRVACWLTGCAR